MNESGVVLRPVGEPGDLGWMVLAHGEIYAAEYGWDATFEALVARIVADFAAMAGHHSQRGWIAELDGRRVGCVLCVPAGEGTAQLRILLADPSARGHGIGAMLVDECVAFARGAGNGWTIHTCFSRGNRRCAAAGEVEQWLGRWV